MPVHVTPRELFKVLLDAFKVGLIKAFKAILKHFLNYFKGRRPSNSKVF